MDSSNAQPKQKDNDAVRQIHRNLKIESAPPLKDHKHNEQEILAIEIKREDEFKSARFLQKKTTLNNRSIKLKDAEEVEGKEI